MTYVIVEPKYCEQCGGQWFRRSGDPEVKCAVCVVRARKAQDARDSLIAAEMRYQRQWSMHMASGTIQ